MNKSYLLCADLGVSFIKAAIYNFKGEAIASISKKAPGEFPKPGIFLQNSEELFYLMIDAFKDIIQQSKINKDSIEAIGFSSAMGGAMGINENWEPVSDWSIISDTRFNPYVVKMQNEMAETILKNSGTNFPVFAAKILWLKNDFPEIYKKVKKFIFLCGYIVGKLGDLNYEEAFADRTFMSVSALADIKNNKWSEEIYRHFAIDINSLPRIVNSNEVVARLSKKYADVCGLRSGIPLIAGAGDKPAGTLGAGLVAPGLMLDESASFGALTLCTDKYIPDTRFKTLENIVSPVPGLYIPSIYLFGSGMTHEWYKETFGTEEKRAAESTGESAFYVLDKEAEKIPPGSDRLMSIGLLGGRGYPSDPDIKGMWIGQSWSHKRGHFWRSLLESFAYEYACVMGVMKSNYPEIKFDEIRVIGGASKSGLWNQIKADVLGIPYVKLNRDDFALLGDALLAGNAIGAFSDLKSFAESFAQKTEKIIPEKKNTDYYKKYVEIYKDLIEKNRNIFTELKNIPEYK